MLTRILQPTEQNISLCASEIKSGGIAAFPTETVYGLGASAFDEKAVEKIYQAKGRPSDNPLIVHIWDKSQLSDLVEQIPLKARILISRFMPGALTLVFNKKKAVPDIVTGGLNTIAVRMPKNEIALKLIKECGVPICAPSANKSGLPSPTTAKHVLEDLNGKIKYILDGGDCEVGVESTVLDVTCRTPRLLRAGGVTVEEIEKAIGNIEIYQGTDKALAPGMKYKHYSPKAEVFFSAYYAGMDKTISEYYERLKNLGRNPVIFALANNVKCYAEKNVVNIGKDYKEYAKNLFSAMRKADKDGYDAIIAEGVGHEGMGATIINRLVKSSGGQII